MVHDFKISTPIAILNESASARVEYKNWDIFNLSWSHDGNSLLNINARPTDMLL